MILEYGSKGLDVKALQNALLEHGFSPGVIDAQFGPGTEAAVLAFQRSHALGPDGIVGEATFAALAAPVAKPLNALDAPERLGVKAPAPMPPATRPLPNEPFRNINTVSRMLPAAPLANIRQYLPSILLYLDREDLSAPRFFLMAISTIAAETAGFKPIDEGISRYNTSPMGHPFDLYDNRRDLGNRGYPDGSNFKGRGFVQLTGRANYERMDAELNLRGSLIVQPWEANHADLAAAILARFLAQKREVLEAALRAADLLGMRRAVNGGTHGLQAFRDAWAAGDAVLRNSGLSP